MKEVAIIRGPAHYCGSIVQCFTHLAKKQKIPSLLQYHSKEWQIYWGLCQVGLCDQNFEASFSESPLAQETFL